MKKTIILLALAIFQLSAFNMQLLQAQETVVDGVAAIVGKNIIKYSDIERAYAQVRMRQGVADAFNNRCAILENLILNNLLVHKGEIDSVEVGDEEVNQYVEYYLKNDLRNYGTRENLREQTGFTYDELKEQYQRMIRNSLMSRRVEYQITEDVTVTPREVTEFFNTIPQDSLPMMPERYELSEIVIEPQISEAERDRVRTQLAELRERVIKGEKFAMLATLYSQDPVSAKKGGELGFFSRGDMVSAFESAAFALKPGEVSPIVETQYGFHIIQLIERRGNTINARHILITPQVSPDDLLAARIRLDSIADQVRAGNITFEDAARKYSTAANAKQGGTCVNANDGSTHFDKQAVAERFPAVAVQGMEEGQISPASVIKNDNGRQSYCIIRLNHKLAEHKANLSDDYDNIYNAALADAKQRRLKQWAAKQMSITYIHLSDDYKDCVFKNLQ